jgi:hypothetical protein
VSSEMGSRPRCVILTVRRAVFICGETDVMVPWMMVPGYELEIDRRRIERGEIPFLSSIVTVSFAHFMRNLPGAEGSVRHFAKEAFVRAQLML